MKDELFPGLKLGDKMWSLDLGDCTVVYITSEYVTCAQYSFIEPRLSYDYRISDGKKHPNNPIQQLYKEKPESLPVPRRYVQRTTRITGTPGGLGDTLLKLGIGLTDRIEVDVTYVVEK